MKKHTLTFAWIVALVATLGSLYFSEIRMFEPCKLCWLQRIFMYPLAILLGIGVYRNEHFIVKYAQPLAFIGWMISIWHVLETKVPGLSNVLPCTVGVPCNIHYINWFGFITIPVLSLTAYTLINILFFMDRKNHKE